MLNIHQKQKKNQIRDLQLLYQIKSHFQQIRQFDNECSYLKYLQDESILFQYHIDCAIDAHLNNNIIYIIDYNNFLSVYQIDDEEIFDVEFYGFNKLVKINLVFQSIYLGEYYKSQFMNQNLYITTIHEQNTIHYVYRDKSINKFECIQQNRTLNFYQSNNQLLIISNTFDIEYISVLNYVKKLDIQFLQTFHIFHKGQQVINIPFETSLNKSTDILNLIVIILDEFQQSIKISIIHYQLSVFSGFGSSSIIYQEEVQHKISNLYEYEGFEIATKVKHFRESIDEISISTQRISKISVQNEAFLLQQTLYDNSYLFQYDSSFKTNWKESIKYESMEDHIYIIYGTQHYFIRPCQFSQQRYEVIKLNTQTKEIGIKNRIVKLKLHSYNLLVQTYNYISDSNQFYYLNLSTVYNLLTKFYCNRIEITSNKFFIEFLKLEDFKQCIHKNTIIDFTILNKNLYSEIMLLLQSGDIVIGQLQYPLYQQILEWAFGSEAEFDDIRSIRTSKIWILITIVLVILKLGHHLYNSN